MYELNRLLVLLIFMLLAIGCLLRYYYRPYQINYIYNVKNEYTIEKVQRESTVSTTHQQNLPSERDIIEKYRLCSKKNITVYNRDLRVICSDIAQDEHAYYTPRKYLVNPLDYSLTIDATTVCDNATRLLVLVETEAVRLEVRSDFRAIWAESVSIGHWPGAVLPKSSIKSVFFAAYDDSWNFSLQKEAEVHQDILQVSTHESPYNKSRKFLQAFKWAQTNCQQAKYIVVMRDDTVLNIPLLIETLEPLNFTKSIMASYYDDLESAYLVPKKQYPFFYLPRIANSLLYVLSQDVLQPMLDMSGNLAYVSRDDVFITGILRKVLKIQEIEVKKTIRWTKPFAKACDLMNNLVVSGTNMNLEYFTTTWLNINETKC